MEKNEKRVFYFTCTVSCTLFWDFDSLYSAFPLSVNGHAIGMEIMNGEVK